MNIHKNLLGSADDHAVTDETLIEQMGDLEITITKQWHNGKRVYIIEGEDASQVRTAGRAINAALITQSKASYRKINASKNRDGIYVTKITEQA